MQYLYHSTISLSGSNLEDVMKMTKKDIFKPIAIVSCITIVMLVYYAWWPVLKFEDITLIMVMIYPPAVLICAVAYMMMLEDIGDSPTMLAMTAAVTVSLLIASVLSLIMLFVSANSNMQWLAEVMTSVSLANLVGCLWALSRFMPDHISFMRECREEGQ